MTHYIALLDEKPGAYGVVFPDAWLHRHGRHGQQAIRNAQVRSAFRDQSTPTANGNGEMNRRLASQCEEAGLRAAPLGVEWALHRQLRMPTARRL